MKAFIQYWWRPLYMLLSIFLVWYAFDFYKRYQIEEEERIAVEKQEREEERRRLQEERNRRRVEIPIETGVAPLP